MIIIFPSVTKIGVFYYFIYLFFIFSPEGQPESIVEDIENMVRTYVDKVWDFFSSKKGTSM
jgi:hypothetical protein